jgi:hypothetical protein
MNIFWFEINNYPSGIKFKFQIEFELKIQEGN